MPSKRPHRKSRFGCDQCRKRRVKCDERMPRCTNCTQRSEDCRFSRRQGLQQHHQQHHSSVESSSPGRAVMPSLSAVSDAAIMHHWCTETCKTFTVRGADLFRGYVGREALRHEFLWHAVVAVTLLHLATDITDSVAARPLVHAALEHLNQTFSGLRAALRLISLDNSDAIYACSLLIMVSGTVSPFLPFGRDDETELPVKSVLRIVDSLKGIGSVIKHSRQWIGQSPLADAMDLLEPQLGTGEVWPQAVVMRELLAQVVEPSSYRHVVLEKAIQKLETIYRRELCAVSWVLHADGDFREELRQEEPFMLLLFLHFGVLLSTMDGMWWKRFLGARIVEELSTELSSYRPEWNAVTNWCRQQVGLEALPAHPLSPSYAYQCIGLEQGQYFLLSFLIRRSTVHTAPCFACSCLRAHRLCENFQPCAPMGKTVTSRRQQ
ncbi:hypothetical protein B0I35DRAFT_364637 [Stachybotrys elegans]|uniref:Zn(2)-C6 fungal-type domain-containing protein n=1 Tax=Stachybotrys elegans TaxID=80388 RepID=A0A8K0SC06_9HYPO|nr:hypothetical protein B0I35DRAFT_364637 [Stachybotrys elegans]